jgi:hypothetical protein
MSAAEAPIAISTAARIIAHTKNDKLAKYNRFNYQNGLLYKSRVMEWRTRSPVKARRRRGKGRGREAV